ncbi:type VI secretion system-associated protein TagF [Tabrizicola sp.]|uniref:type VI secretion system-associated protein TagF n=1 Tax=Tabrizicola sp. TaxID=2005166 RepID=UPI002FDE4BFE
MPDEVLGEPDDGRPVAGFFGKLPATGDFVSRGLPDTFRKPWDAWLTRHVAPLQREGLIFPPGGLRFRLPSGGHLAAGLILPSQDSAGRLFPLSLLFIAGGDVTPDQIDPWCDAATGLEILSADDLWHALDALPAPVPDGPATGPMQLWVRSQPPLFTAPDDPDTLLRKLLDPA